MKCLAFEHRKRLLEAIQDRPKFHDERSARLSMDRRLLTWSAFWGIPHYALDRNVIFTSVPQSRTNFNI
jgi:hypothetical protein